MLLKGKVALVTGAARNVGRGIALRLAREGAHVLLDDIESAALEGLAAQCRADGLSVHPVLADISNPTAVQSMFKQALKEFGGLDILVNNAVIHTPSKAERGPFLRVRAAAWNEFLSRNLDALFYTSQAAAKIMTRCRRGSIINISSNGAVQAHRQRLAYDTFKGALESFTRALAVDLAPWNVRVNALRPCAVADAPAPGTPAEVRDRRLGAMIPLGRIARPADVAWAVVFLAADDAAFITGQIFNIDGGMLEQSRPPELELEPVIKPEDLDLEDGLIDPGGNCRSVRRQLSPDSSGHGNKA